MKRVLVGTRNGNAVINWPAVFVVGLIAGIVAGAAGAGTWFLLTGEFSVGALVVPVPFSLGYFAGEAIRTRFWVPVDRLSALD